MPNHELDKARFDETFRKNFDYGEGFYSNMPEYKSVADFLKRRKKKIKSKKKANLKILQKILKQAIDFPLDESIKDPITPEESGSLQVALPFGGITDEYLPLNDQEDKDPTKLNFGRDYQNDENYDNIEEEINKIINPSQSPLLGLPDGMDPEDLTADKTISNRTENYGTTDLGNQTFENIHF